MFLSFISVFVTGCEHGGDDGETVTTNIVNNVSGGGDEQVVTNNQTTASNSGGGGGGGSNPPPGPTSKQVVISNGATGSVAVSVNGAGAVLSSGGSKTWTYTGSSFSWSYDTGAGYDVSTTVSDGLNHLYNIYDSASVPGTVEARGSSF